MKVSVNLKDDIRNVSNQIIVVLFYIIKVHLKKKLVTSKIALVNAINLSISYITSIILMI